MSGLLTSVITFVFGLLVIIVWNKMRTRGKIWCFFARKDKSLLPRLRKLEYDFIEFNNRAYDVYPDLVRVARFPPGWPFLFQELVPTLLYDEEDAIPRDWRDPKRVVQVRAMELKAALEENWVRKLVHEAAVAEAGGVSRFNWRRALPFVLLIAGILALVALFIFR